MNASHEITGKNVPVKDAAELLGMSQQFIRIGLQRGILPFGSAVKLSTRWTYYVSLARLYEYAGLPLNALMGGDENYA